MKFGKLSPKANPKTLKMSRYLLADAPPAPPSKSYWEYRVKNYPMFSNDVLGDCVLAAGGHMEEAWSAHTGPEVVLTDADIIAAYEAVGGYVPGDPSTDNGTAITDFLEWWQTTGLAGIKIAGWASINPHSIDNVKKGVYLFGGIDIGIQVPQSAMDQNAAGKAWDMVPNDGGIVGGHSIPVLGYGAEGCTCITWGMLQQMSWEWFQAYCDEAYCVISPNWLAQSGEAPNHLNLAELQADLATIKA
jgi:hypothetical protein